MLTLQVNDVIANASFTTRSVKFRMAHGSRLLI